MEVIIMSAEIDALAAEGAKIREAMPASPKTGRKRVVYPDDYCHRAAGVFKRSGLPVHIFAKRLGVSATAVGRWDSVAERSSNGFVEVQLDDAELRSSTATPSTAPQVSLASAGMPLLAPMMVVFRETRVELPAALDSRTLATVLAALHRGASC
jgi:hypothetical protein